MGTSVSPCRAGVGGAGVYMASASSLSLKNVKITVGRCRVKPDYKVPVQSDKT